MSRQINIKKGDTKVLNFIVTNNDGTPTDLTGSTLYFTVKKSVDDPDSKALIQKSWSAHTNAAGGLSSLTLMKDDTYRQAGSYFWEVQFKGSGGAISTADMGELIIAPHLTYTTA